MAAELALRFLIGGLVVSAFAVVSDVLRPKHFSGVFGAAPSVAIATLGMAFATHDGGYAAIEGRSMIAGGLAFFAYALLVGWLLLQRHASSLAAAAACWGVWLVVALTIWAVALA